jgi:hypothetical protein
MLGLTKPGDDKWLPPREYIWTGERECTFRQYLGYGLFLSKEAAENYLAAVDQAYQQDFEEPMTKGYIVRSLGYEPNYGKVLWSIYPPGTIEQDNIEATSHSGEGDPSSRPDSSFASGIQDTEGGVSMSIRTKDSYRSS